MLVICNVNFEPSTGSNFVCRMFKCLNNQNVLETDCFTNSFKLAMFFQLLKFSQFFVYHISITHINQNNVINTLCSFPCIILYVGMDILKQTLAKESHKHYLYELKYAIYFILQKLRMVI